MNEQRTDSPLGMYTPGANGVVETPTKTPPSVLNNTHVSGFDQTMNQFNPAQKSIFNQTQQSDATQKTVAFDLPKNTKKHAPVREDEETQEMTSD
jgi:hypothetical protein